MDLPTLRCRDEWTPSCLTTACTANTASLLLCLASMQVFVLSYYRHRPHNRPKQQRRDYTVHISPLLAKLEVAALLLDMALSAAVVLLQDSTCSLVLAPVLLSIYLLVLRLGRSYFKPSTIDLQTHSMILYGAQWSYLSVILPTILFGYHFRNDILEGLVTAARLLLFTALFLTHIASPRTNPHLSREKFGQEEKASLLSRLTFHWIHSLVWKGFHRTLEASDLYPLDGGQTSSHLIKLMSTLAPRSSLSFFWRVYRLTRDDLLEQGAWAAATGIFVFVPALLMSVILDHLSSSSRESSTAWFAVGALLIPGLINGVADCQSNWIWRKIGAKLRSVLMAEIYGKILRMGVSSPSFDATEDGNLLNLISADVEIVSETVGCVYLVWATFPLQTAIGTYLLYMKLGIAGILGVVLMLAFLPLNILVSRRLMAAQDRLLKASDARIQACSEVLENIRTVKYCAWEEPCSEKVLEKRHTELKNMRTRLIWWSLALTLFYALPFIMTSITLFFYAVVFGHSLDSATIFPSLAIFSVLRIPINRMADAVTFLLQTRVSFQRICAHLEGNETAKDRQLDICTSFLGFDNATMAWPTTGLSRESLDDTHNESIPLVDRASKKSFKLHSLTIKFEPAALNLVCGQSGCGKSSLLLGLLGELDVLQGRIHVPQSEIHGERRQGPTIRRKMMAYCPQESWIQNKSIRANIVMSFAFDTHRYEAVLHAVALLQDLSVLYKGDETVCGENGSRLSGGQKQRVALARALYSPSHYLFLDDCLSALDSSTARHVLCYAIQGPLMRNRTCIFATHNVELLAPYAKHIVILEDGRVRAQGCLEDMVKSGCLQKEDPVVYTPVSATFSSDATSTLAPNSPNLFKKGDEDSDEDENKYTEHKTTGSISWTVISTYLRAMGSPRYWILVIAGFVLQQVVALGQAVWMKHWASQFDRLHTDHSITESIPSGFYLSIYLAIGGGFMVVTMARDMSVFVGSLRASRDLYRKLLSAVLHSRFAFFDRVPLGQITNRFSRDVEIVDQSLPPFSINAIQLAATLLFSVGLIATILPAFLLVAALVLAAYCAVAAIYLSGARDFKRIEAVERSPVYQQFTETLRGRVSIRAYAQGEALTSRYLTLIDRLNRPYLAQWASKEWLTFRITVLSSLISFSTGAFILLQGDSIEPGPAGLALNYASSFTETVMWLVQIYGMIQQYLISADRMIEYTQLDQEEDTKEPDEWGNPPHNLASRWPSNGSIVFKSYAAAYGPEKTALESISLQIRPKERIGIVGRTGAGKSTFGLSLIRGVEATEGRIEIDGIDIASLPLKRLRQAVTLVAQDPRLFRGSLRDNLCPSPLRRIAGNNDDEAMLVAAQAVGLASEYADLDRHVDAMSRGQQQLVCIARGLFRRSPILVLDEATASVDDAADKAMQLALRAGAASAGATVIAIAHRLLTVADYDRVVVLDDGRIVEEGAPRELLQRRGGGAFFRRLCEESGQLALIEQAATGAD